MKLNSKSEYPKLRTSVPTIDRLYLDYTPEEKAEAQDTIARYVALVWRIYQRIKRDK